MQAAHIRDGSWPTQLRVSTTSPLNPPIADIGADIIFNRFVPEADITHLNLRRFLGSLPKPERDKDDERTDNGGCDIPCDGETEAGSERDRYLVEARKQPKHAEQQAADERTGKADGQIAEQPEADQLEQAGEASTDQADDDPDNQLIDRGHVASPELRA